MSGTDPALTTVVIGAGFAGIGTAIRLLQNGIDDFVILERDVRPGGTWRDNTYPGAACDIPSRLYSYSFAPNAGWSHTYSGSDEILAYIDRMIDDHDLDKHIRYSHLVTGLRFAETDGTWQVQVADREPIIARAVVVASGPLSTPGYPEIPGLEEFTGHRMHSAAWDHDYDFAGKKVGVIGTGASAVQLIPELVRAGAEVTVYQRTPGWVLPRLNRHLPTGSACVSHPAVDPEHLTRPVVPRTRVGGTRRGVEYAVHPCHRGCGQAESSCPGG